MQSSERESEKINYPREEMPCLPELSTVDNFEMDTTNEYDADQSFLRGNSAKYGTLVRNLYEMINTADKDTADWLPVGGFVIKDKQKFEQKLRDREVSKSISSFQRMLANYQFRRSTQLDGSVNYFHDFFKQGQLELLNNIVDRRRNSEDPSSKNGHKELLEKTKAENEDLKVQLKMLTEEAKLTTDRLKLLMTKLNRAESLVLRYEEELRRRILAEGHSVGEVSKPSSSSDVLESAESLLILHGGQDQNADQSPNSTRASKRAKV